MNEIIRIIKSLALNIDKTDVKTAETLLEDEEQKTGKVLLDNFEKTWKTTPPVFIELYAAYLDNWADVLEKLLSWVSTLHNQLRDGKSTEEVGPELILPKTEQAIPNNLSIEDLQMVANNIQQARDLNLASDEAEFYLINLAAAVNHKIFLQQTRTKLIELCQGYKEFLTPTILKLMTDHDRKENFAGKQNPKEIDAQIIQFIEDSFLRDDNRTFDTKLLAKICGRYAHLHTLIEKLNNELTLDQQFHDFKAFFETERTDLVIPLNDLQEDSLISAKGVFGYLVSFRSTYISYEENFVQQVNNKLVALKLDEPSNENTVTHATSRLSALTSYLPSMPHIGLPANPMPSLNLYANFNSLWAKKASAEQEDKKSPRLVFLDVSPK